MSADSGTGAVAPQAARPKSRAIGMIVALVVVIAIVVAVAAWYVLTSGTPGGAPPAKPTVTFPPSSSVAVDGPSNNRTAMWDVLTVSSEYAFSSFKMEILKDDVSLAPAQELVPDTIMSFGAEVKAVVSDVDSDGKVTAGDEFRVYGMTAYHSWTLQMRWSDDSVIQSQSWSTPVMSVVVNLSADGTNWTVTITSAPMNLKLTNVTLTIRDSTGSIVVPMSAVPFANLTVANQSIYHVVYQSLMPSSNVTVGSRLIVSRTNYPSGHKYEILLGGIILTAGTFV